ncbi:membrane protein [Patiriisocius marinistellae]|uniref:Membrane protein n=1 Tax=Patiriisocius marinistellae TaxID=2494560 RepID=A0A5J4FWM4_9FLAO|nr:membrane protein [Patiriisocius marinistellae]
MPSCIIAQEAQRVLVNGYITAPVGDIVEGIHVYNISSQKGTVTDANGEFKLEMAINERLEVTSLQYVGFKVIVDKGIIDNMQVRIYLNPMVNELKEVIIRPYDLSGNIAVDVGKINTFNPNQGWDLSYEQLEFGYEFAPDGVTAIQGNVAQDAYYNGQQQYGGDLIGGLGLLKNLIFGRSEKEKPASQLQIESELIANGIRGRFTNQFLTENYNIPAELATDFVYYVQESGIPPTYLKPENKLLLLDYLTGKSKEYLRTIEK